MKKVLICLVCIISLFYFSNVSALEDSESNTNDQTNTGENNNTESEGTDQTPPDEGGTNTNPDNSNQEGNDAGNDGTTGDENINPDLNGSTGSQEQEKEESEEVEQEEEKKEEQPSTNNQRPIYNSSPNELKPSYSYTSNNTKKKTANVRISNINLKTKKELAGSKLQVQDEEGTVLYEWESTKKSYLIENLEEGTYYLIIVSTPEGYEVENQKLEFIVEASEEEIVLKVENSVVEEKPDVFSCSTILLLSILMIDIAIAIWIIIYVKKNKIKQ